MSCFHLFSMLTWQLFTPQNESIQKSIIECFENSDHIEVQQPPLTPTIARSATATPNPFLAEMNNHRPKTPMFNGNHTPVNGKHTSAVRTVFSPTPAVATEQQTLPPIPPRQRPKVYPQIRIPINIVRRGQKIEQSKTENNNSSPVDVQMAGSTPKTTPDENEPKLNGNSCYDDSVLTIHDPCPCKSGAHPKVPSVRLDNGFGFNQQRGENSTKFMLTPFDVALNFCILNFNWQKY